MSRYETVFKVAEIARKIIALVYIRRKPDIKRQKPTRRRSEIESRKSYLCVWAGGVKASTLQAYYIYPLPVLYTAEHFPQHHLNYCEWVNKGGQARVSCPTVIIQPAFLIYVNGGLKLIVYCVVLAFSEPVAKSSQWIIADHCKKFKQENLLRFHWKRFYLINDRLHMLSQNGGAVLGQ